MKTSRSIYKGETPITYHEEGAKVGCASDTYGFGSQIIDRPLVSFDYVTDTGDSEPIFVTEELARKISDAFMMRRSPEEGKRRKK